MEGKHYSEDCAVREMRVRITSKVRAHRFIRMYFIKNIIYHRETRKQIAITRLSSGINNYI